MKRLLLFALLSLLSFYSEAQKKTTPAKPKPVKAATDDDLRSAYMDADYAKAVTIADLLLAKNPGNQRIMTVKAMAYGMLGNKEQVRRTADQLYPNNPDTEASFLAVLPLNLSRTVMKRDAAWYLAEAAKLSPSSPVIYLVGASLYVDDSLYDIGRKTAQAGLALLTDKHPAMMHAQMANLLHMSNGKAEAYQFMDALMAKHPADSAVQTTYYAMLLRDKKYPEALTRLNSLATQHPADLRLRKERAFLYEEMNRHGDACAEALKLADEDDDYFHLLRKLGCPQAFANLSPAQVKAYTYDVDYHGMKYQFIVQPKKIDMAEGARFDWKMTINDDMQGTVAISKAALDTAHGQMNKFSGGASDLTNLTTVWISNAVYRDLKRNGKCMIAATEEGLKSFSLVEESEVEEATITNSAGHTRALKTLHIRSEDGQEDLWVNDDAANPLITRMDIGWSIALKSVQ